MNAITFSGEERPRYRVSTQLPTLDLALRGGLSLPSMIELYGFTFVGKSTLSYYLSGCVRPAGFIALADFEHFNESYLASNLATAGFAGTVHRVNIDSGEKALTEIRDCLLNPDYQAAILDSVGTLVLEQEIAEEVTLQAAVGRKAALMARGTRLALYALKRNPALFVVINQLHHKINFGFGGGLTTTGGVAIQNAAMVRIRLKKEPQEYDDYVVVNGAIDKLREGGAGGFFKFVIVPNYGVHKELTYLEDALYLGIARQDRTIKLGDKSYGYKKTLVANALAGDVEALDDFRIAINDALGTSYGLDNSEKRQDQ